MLIGLHSDRSRAGKDSVAGILVRKYGFRQVALADAIRKMLLEIDPWVEDDSNYEIVRLSQLHKDYNGDWDQIKATCRESVDLMIALGQSARDIISEDVWLNAAFPTMNYHPERDGHIVISDIRQPNEVEFLQRWGGELWYVERPSLDDSNKRGMDGLLRDAHFEARIVNDGSLADLEDTVSWIIEQDWPV